MDDVYLIKNRMTKEQMFRLRLMDGFNFAPITADAVLELSKDFFQNNGSDAHDGQMLYLAIAEEEGPGKSILESKHREVILTLDAPEDMEVYEKFGLSAYRQARTAENYAGGKGTECIADDQRSRKTSEEQLQHDQEGYKSPQREGVLRSYTGRCERYRSVVA
mgnify:CR=1 FL=1